MKKILIWVLLFTAGVTVGAVIMSSLNSGRDAEQADAGSGQDELVEGVKKLPAEPEVIVEEAEVNGGTDGSVNSGNESTKQFYKDQILGLGGAVGELTVEGLTELWNITPRISCGKEPVTVDGVKNFLCVVTNPTNGYSFDTTFTVEQVEGFGLGVRFSNSTDTE